MEGSEQIKEFEDNLKNLVSSFKKFYGTLKTLKGDNVNKSLTKQGDDYWENLHSRMEKIKGAYDTFSDHTAKNVDEFVKEISNIEEEERKDNSVLKNALLEMKTSKRNNLVVQKYEEYIAKKEERLKRMKKSNDVFSNNINEITEDLVNKVDKIEKDDTSEVDEMLKNFNEEKEIIIEQNKALKQTSLIDNKDPVFIYRDNKISKIDVELVMKYPGSYFYKQYIGKDSHRTADGDVFIDCDSENDELIVKYMNDDDSLADDLNMMSIEKKIKLIDDLDFLILPIKKNVLKHIYRYEDNEMMEVWKDKKVVVVNGKIIDDFNLLLKKNQLLDPIHDTESVKNILIYIYPNFKYIDVIEDYLRNDKKISSGCVKKYYNYVNDDELIHEMEKIEIKMTLKEKNIIKDYFFHPSTVFLDTNIIDRRYDEKLREWLGNNHNWKLIYRASANGYKGDSFHECCDDVGPTLIVIKSSEGWIFGGYTTQSWSEKGIYIMI